MAAVRVIGALGGGGGLSAAAGAAILSEGAHPAMNEDASQQCIDAAKRAMAQSDWDKALRLLEKSIRLNPNVRDHRGREREAGPAPRVRTRAEPAWVLGGRLRRRC